MYFSVFYLSASPHTQRGSLAYQCKGPSHCLALFPFISGLEAHVVGEIVRESD